MYFVQQNKSSEMTPQMPAICRRNQAHCSCDGLSNLVELSEHGFKHVNSCKETHKLIKTLKGKQAHLGNRNAFVL